MYGDELRHVLLQDLSVVDFEASVEKHLYLAAEIYAFGGITYLILSSGQIQWWAKEGLDQSPGNGRPANGDEKEALLSGNQHSNNKAIN